VHNDFLLFLVDLVGLSFMNNRDMNFLHMGGMLLVDDGLDVFVDMLLNDDWLMMFMNHLLMVLMYDILSVLNKNVHVVLMHNVLMDFLQNGLRDVSLDFDSEVMLFDGLALVDIFVGGFFLMLYHYSFLENLFYDRGALVLLRTNIGLGSGLSDST
jgi:hypothetical protein